MGPRNSEPFAGLHSHVMHEGLLVFGVPAEIERNDPVAHEVEHNLLPCWGQPDNLTDRWDARLLLDEVSLTLSRRQWEAREPFDDPEANSEKLDFERYRDLDGSKESHLQLHGRTNSSPSESPSESGSEGYEGTLPPPGYAAIPFGYGDTTIPQNVGEANAAAPTDGHVRQTSSTGGKLYNTVGFSYDSTAQQADLSSMSGQAGSQQAQQAQHVPAPGSDEPAFVPDFVIPEHLRRALPTTARHFKVIQQTANFVREGGGQLEVLLRVKQAGNPLFDFLLPTSTLHPFYRWLVTTRPEDLVVINAAPLSWGRKGEGQNGQHGNALDAGARGETRGPVQQGQREVQQAEQRAAPHPLQQEQEGQREPQDEAAELDHAEPAGRAGYCVQYGPEPRPPEALSSLDLLSQYDDDFVKSPRGGSSASQDTETRAGSRSYGGDGADEGAGDGQQLGQQQQQRQDRGGVAVQGTLPYETAPGVGISQAQGPGPEEQGEGTAAGPAEGVEPPADMLAVMQKLVAFVQKNGWRFEGMVRAKESDNPLFGFLHPWHPQHLRYRHMLVNAIGSQDTDTIMLYAAPGESSAFQHAADDRAAGRSSSPQPPDQGTLPTEAKASEGHDLEPQDAEHGEDATGKPLPPWLYSFKLSSKGPAEIKQQQPSDHVPKVSSSVSHPAEGRAVPAVPAASATPSTISDMQQLATVGTGTKADKPAAAASSSATAAGGSHTLPPWLREKMVAAASAAAGSISAQLATTKGAAAATGPVKVKLQANPSIAKVSLRLGPVLPASEEEGGEKAAEEAHVEAVAGGAEEAPGRASPSAMASVAPVQEGLLGRAHEGEQPIQAAPAEVNDAEAEERKKAERRRRARELLLQKQQEAALQAARQRQQQLSAISIHRKAFLEEGSEGAGGLVAEGARNGVTAAHAAADVREHAVEVEEGEIAAAEVAAPKPGGEGTAQLGRPPRHPSRLPLVEDLVTLRMKHASSGGDLTASGGERVPGGGTSAAAAARHGLLAPPGQTIAGHRAAFGEGGTASGSQARGRRDGAAGREDSGDGSGAVGQLVPGQSAEQGEAALHLRRIRDRIAAMTAGGASSRPGSGLSTASSGPTTSNVRQPRVGGESVSRASRQGTPSSSSTDSDGSEVGGKAGMRWRVASPARQKVSSSRSRSRHSASRRRHRSRSHSRNISSSGSSGASGSSKGRGKSRTGSHSRERPAHRAQQKRRRRGDSVDRHEEGRERKDRKHRRHSSGRRHKH